jgi:hypothetical protein
LSAYWRQFKVIIIGAFDPLRSPENARKEAMSGTGKTL